MADVRKKRGRLPLNTKIPCFICTVLEPLATAHDHHRTPRAFGGTDDGENRVWLCASCHTRLHRVQEFIVQGKMASAYELCHSIFGTKEKYKETLWTLANEAASAEAEVGDSFSAHQSTVTVNLAIDADVWATIKARAIDGRTSASKLAVQLLRSAVGIRHERD